MNDVYKIIPILIIVFIIIGLSLVFYLKYKKTPQPTKEEAYKRGLGYYTAEESLGCVNDNLSCTEPGEETFIQYCIPNPTTGRGCINLNGIETYDTSIRKKPCNISCHSHKFVVEDKVQVKNPGTLVSNYIQVTGSGCNKVIDNRLGLDYTDFFLGEYNKDTENPNTYQLKSCIPSEGFGGYYQKIFTCQKNDPKGQNNCVFTCGSEGNVLGLTGLFGSKLSKNLLKYFPIELDYSGGKRYVCYDLNGVDQISILNYTDKVPKDFVYPNYCYKHSTVNNYNGDLWPNSDASNVFIFPIDTLSSETEYFTVNGTSLAPLFGVDGLLIETYDIFKDFNSYVKILIGNEIALLKKIVQLNNPSYSLNLYYDNSREEILKRDNYSLIFYLNGNEVGNFEERETLYFNNISSTNEPITGFEYTGNYYEDEDLNLSLFEFINKPGERFIYKEVIYDMYTYDTNKNSSQVDNPFVIFSFLPLKSNFSNGFVDTNNIYYVCDFSFLTYNFDELNKNIGFKTEKYFFPLLPYTTVYFEVNTDGKNYSVFGFCSLDTNTDVFAGDTETKTKFYSSRIFIPIETQDSIVLNNSSRLVSQIYIVNSELSIGTTSVEIEGSDKKLTLPNGLVTTYWGPNATSLFNFTLVSSFKTGNVKLLNNRSVFSETNLSEGTAKLKYKNDDLAELYIVNNSPSLSSGGIYNVVWSLDGVSNSAQISFEFKSKGIYTTTFLGNNYEFVFDIVDFKNYSSVFTIFNDAGEKIGAAGLSISTYVLTFQFDADRGYTATPSNPVLFTNLFYVYGNNASPNLEGDTSYYFWFPILLTKEVDPTNSVTFTNYPGYNFRSDNIVFNTFFPPNNTEEFTYFDFEEFSGIGNVKFEYVSFNNSGNHYYMRNLSRYTSLGNYNIIPDLDLGLYLYNSDIIQDNEFNFQIYNNNGSLYNPVSSTNTLQLIRRNSPYFNYAFNQPDSNLNYKESKIKEYLTMISNQNNGFSIKTVNNNKLDYYELIITPQKTVILAADYSVFKSPYKINEDGSYKFLCYNDNGVPLAKGTRITLGENEKMYINKSCSDYNTNIESICGVQGLLTEGKGTSISACIQPRKTQNVNFSADCLNYTRDRYNTLGGLFEHGIKLREMYKSITMGGQEDDNINVFEDFFTREEDFLTIYKPNQELYINKNQQNFYLSLKNNNTDFVVEPSSWQRVFTYQNLIKSTIFETYLDTQNYIPSLSTINIGLGKDLSSAYEIPGNFEYRMIFKNSTTGINTQSYFNSGVEFYYDTNQGNDYTHFATNSFQMMLDALNTGEGFNADSTYGGQTFLLVVNFTNFTPQAFLPYNFDSLKSTYFTKYPTGNWIPNLVGTTGKVVLKGSQYFSYSNGNNYPADEVENAMNVDYKIFTGYYNNINLRLLGSVLYGYPNNEDATGRQFGTLQIPTFPNNINTYVADARIVKFTSNSKTGYRILFTITDNNLGKDLSNVSVGDFVNIDSNFFTQLYFNLIGNNASKTLEQDINLVYPGSVDNPTPKYNGKVTSNRLIHIYGNATYRNAVLAINKLFATEIFCQKDEPCGNKKVVIDDTIFISSTNIKIFDILGICTLASSENIYLIRIIGIEEKKDTKGDVTEITYTVQVNLNNDFINTSIFTSNYVNFVIINLKKGTPNVQEITNIVENKVSFYFDIDDYNIINFKEGTTGTNIIYDSKTINYSVGCQISGQMIPVLTYIGEYHQLTEGESKDFVPLNSFNYKLSCRYIKKETQIPFYKLNDTLYASMTRLNNIDFFDTKLASYVTEFTAKKEEDGIIYYFFKEFREDYGYGNPQIEKTFAVDDIIEYITKVNSGNVNNVPYSNDNYVTEIVASFKVVSIEDSDTTITIEYNNVNTNIIYDYKCVLIQSNDSKATSSPFNLSKNKIVSEGNFGTKNSTYNLIPTSNGINIYQLPYITLQPNITSPEIVLVLGTNKVEESSSILDLIQCIILDNLSLNLEGIRELNRKSVNHDLTKCITNFSTINATNNTIPANSMQQQVYNSSADVLNLFLYSYPRNWIRGNRLDVLRLSSTTLRNTKSANNNYISIDINSMSAKPYGSEVVLNNNYVTKTGQINHNRMGNVNSFSISKADINGSSLGDIFESNKGFQIILTDIPPSKYEFISIEDNKKLLPYETETDQVITTYDIGSIVSITDRSVRQYFRNNTQEDSRFNFQLQSTSNFELVPRTLYPQDGFVDYTDNVYMQKGEIVRYNDPKELSGLYIVEKSNFGVSISNTETETVNEEYYSFEILTKEMSSNNQEFYSFVYEGDTITEGEQLNDILEKTRDLNIGNLPLQIKTYDKINTDETKTNYCPTFCTKKQPDDKTVKQIIDESFVGQLSYFDNIRYIFETPILVKKDTSKTYLTLGNVPLSYNQNNQYNTTFLSSSTDSTNLLSGFLYFLDLDNDKKFYNKPSCNQDFTYYNETNPGGVSTGVSTFELSNSLLFQFVPCDIESQDYINYGVSDNNLVTLNDPNNIFQWNKFPPINGVTASGGTSIPLINGTSTNVFTGVSGTFETSYITKNISGGKIKSLGRVDWPQSYLDKLYWNAEREAEAEGYDSDDAMEYAIDVRDKAKAAGNPEGVVRVQDGVNIGTSITLNNIDDDGIKVKLTVTDIGNTLEGIGVSDAIISQGTCYSYGDIWYLTKASSKNILTYGFVVPDIDDGKLTEQSFIQLKDFFSPPEDCVINVSSNTGSGFSMSGVSGYQYIKDYTLEGISGVSSGIYSGKYGTETMKVNVKFNGTEIVQRNQAVFTSSDTVNPGNSLYFPSYNVKKTIKTKAIAAFGSNYLGNIKYNNKGFRSMENKIVPTSIFVNYNNTVFTNDIAESSAIVLANNKNLNATNLLDVVRIDFEGNKFSMKLNNFSRPISELNSNLMQKNIINLGAVSSNSINRLISEEIKDMVGVSVRLSLAQIEEHNTNYDPSNNIIPGNTNTQIQFKEIRQNRTTDYIDPSNVCSIFFEPQLEPTKNLDGDSVFLSSDNKSNLGDYINLTVTNQNPYNITGAGINRFYPNFQTHIIYKPNDPISFYAGNNLTYYFDQTDSSNNGFPLVFSSEKGTNFKSNIIDLQKDITPGTVKISYFLDFKEVDPSIYRHVPTFNSSTGERKIIVNFETSFNEVTSVNSDVYYGFNQDKGDLNGGLIKFIYH